MSAVSNPYIFNTKDDYKVSASLINLDDNYNFVAKITTNQNGYIGFWSTIKSPKKIIMQLHTLSSSSNIFTNGYNNYSVIITDTPVGTISFKYNDNPQGDSVCHFNNSNLANWLRNNIGNKFRGNISATL